MSVSTFNFNSACEFLQATEWRDLVFAGLVYVEWVIIYVASVFIVAAMALLRSYQRHKRAAPIPQKVIDRMGSKPITYVIEKSVAVEAEQCRALEILTQVYTVSTYASVTMRGSQALFLFTTCLALIGMGLPLGRALFVPPENDSDMTAFVLSFVGSILFTFTGIMNTNPPTFEEKKPMRDYNLIFTGFIGTTGCRNVLLINLFHLGGVASWAAGHIIATFIRARRCNEPDRDSPASCGVLWGFLIAQLLSLIVLIITFIGYGASSAKFKQCPKCGTRMSYYTHPTVREGDRTCDACPETNGLNGGAALIAHDRGYLHCTTCDHDECRACAGLAPIGPDADPAEDFPLPWFVLTFVAEIVFVVVVAVTSILVEYIALNDCAKFTRFYAFLAFGFMIVGSIVVVLGAILFAFDDGGLLEEPSEETSPSRIDVKPRTEPLNGQ